MGKDRQKREKKDAKNEQKRKRRQAWIMYTLQSSWTEGKKRSRMGRGWDTYISDYRQKTEDVSTDIQ